ncbi:DNA-3-methyladenine glycosylase [Candidatus Saccharibacteria bacterium]|nr:DNA-3-methyladenine glycosylase [Candidatus Saccharibacteria bacterium]
MSSNGMDKQLRAILQKNSLQAAPLLLGWTLVRQTQAGTIKLRIVETEAYHQDDPASHSFRGPTIRTAPMFQAGGRLYIYFTYGRHFCLNIVTGARGRGEAVLIRVAEPIEGIEIIIKNRFGNVKGPSFHNLANGPGKLTQALGIKDTSLSGKKLDLSSIFLEPPQKPVKAQEIVASSRIGIRQATEMPWRFYIKNNPCVSKHPKARHLGL